MALEISGNTMWDRRCIAEDIGRCSTPDRQSGRTTYELMGPFLSCLMSKFYELTPMIGSTRNKEYA